MLVFKAHRMLCHSTLGSRVIKKISVWYPTPTSESQSVSVRVVGAVRKVESRQHHSRPPGVAESYLKKKNQRLATRPRADGKSSSTAAAAGATCDLHFLFRISFFSLQVSGLGLGLDLGLGLG